ncbi:hypothetical protein [Candidatus Thiodictyon syntrophicum]|jgi:hypothetical protein|nr:hypothetical protein [Candidatus Thiodictyon syntrophicum]
MTTLRQFAGGDALVPAGTAWYLADLGELRGPGAKRVRRDGESR